jgi:uncharacterized membrane protein
MHRITTFLLSITKDLMTTGNDGNPYGALPAAPTRGASGGFLPAGRVVGTDRPLVWIKSGFILFKRDPGVWIAIIVVMFVILAVLQMVGPVGSLASSLLTPVFVGGLMVGVKTQDEGGALQLTHAFAGFRDNTGPLVMAGLMFLGAVVAAMAVLAAFGGVAALGGMAGRRTTMGIGMLGAAVVAVLMIPVAMSMYFAPALIMLHRVAPAAALMTSFRVCMRNFAPFLVYGLLYLVIALAATLTFGLGWLVAGPVLVAALYYSYRDTFFEP